MIGFYVAGSVLLISLASFAGAVALVMGAKRLERVVFVLVALSAGALFGDVFIHIIPELLEGAADPLVPSSLVLAGILLFFMLEKFLFWNHAHSHEHAAEKARELSGQAGGGEEPRPLGAMVLLSDGLHNFLDGAIIAGSFLVSVPLGIATTIAVILHEIPQEIGNFALLLHSGYSAAKALWLNFLSALAAAAGALLPFILPFDTASLESVLLPLAAGGFVYIAGSDLVPELRRTPGARDSLVQLMAMLGGVAVMAMLR